MFLLARNNHHPSFHLALPVLVVLACAEPGEETSGLGVVSESSPGAATMVSSTSNSSSNSSSSTDGATDGATGDGGGDEPGGPAPNSSAEPDDSASASDTAPGSTSTGSTSGSTSSGTTSGSTSGSTGAATAEPGPGDEPDASTGSMGTGGDVPKGAVPDENLLVALVGDLGKGAHPRSVYKLILDEGADFLIILGDFDYTDSPSAFQSDLEAVLGTDFPVFAVVGNHDVKKWSGYQPIFEDRLAKIPGAQCSGDLGVDAECTYRGLHFVLSGVGTIGKKGDHEQYIADALAADDSLWSLCAWHKNQRDMQAGDKPDEVGWTAYQHCQQDGAIIVAGHEHSYARTRTLTDLGNAKGQHGATGMPELLEVGPGSTFSVVSGLGGKSIRAYSKNLHDGQQWWATLYTSDYHRKNGVEVKGSKADYGALFMRFHVDGDPNTAHGYFKSVSGEVADEFDVVRKK